MRRPYGTVLAGTVVGGTVVAGSVVGTVVGTVVVVGGTTTGFRKSHVACSQVATSARSRVPVRSNGPSASTMPLASAQLRGPSSAVVLSGKELRGKPPSR